MNDNYNRAKYLEWFASQNPDVKFVFVIPDDGQVKPVESPNIIGMKISTFINKLKD